MKLRRTAAVLAGAIILSGMAACSTRPPPDEVWLYYKAGPTESTHFEKCVPANTKGPWQANNKVYALPTNARTWNIQPEGGDSNEPIKIGTKPTTVDGVQQPGPEVIVWVNTDFFIRTYCGKNNNDSQAAAVRFWEVLGRRYSVSSDSGEFNVNGWKDALNATYVPALKGVTQTAGRKFDADTLDADTNGAWSAMEREMGRTLLAALRSKPGGEFLCGVGYNNDAPVTYSVPQVDPVTGEQLKGPDGKPLPDKEETSVCPPIRVDITSIDYADPNVQKARADVYAAKQRAEAALTEARAKKQAADLLKAGGAQSIEIQKMQNDLAIAQACAAAPSCTMIVGASNPNINVGTK